MPERAWTRTAVAYLLSAYLIFGQQAPPIRIDQPAAPARPAPAQPAPAPGQATPTPATPGAKPPAPPPTTTAPQTQPPVQLTPTPTGGFFLQNASLVEVIDLIAKQLKINYILDPRVKGGVTINTYGEIKPTDLRPLLETILRINNAAMVQVGDLYRIVPIGDVSRLPMSPRVNGKDLPDDERMLLNLIFLKYATVAELSKLIEPFLGEGYKMITYEAANLLLLLDNSRNMKRTMELISLFDSDVFASQRVRLFDVENGRPSDIAKELETVFKAFALSEKSSSVKFMPIDRINTIIAVAPNPGVFTEVENWLKKLDVPIKATAGSIDNHVYRLKYGRAETVAGAIMALYGGYGYGGGYGGMSGGYGGMGAGFGGMGGMGGMGYGGMGGMGYGGGMGGGYGGYPGGGGFPGSFAQATTAPIPYTAAQSAPGPGVNAASPGPTGAVGSPQMGAGDLTGSYLGSPFGSPYGGGMMGRIPHVIPNPFDNTLLIQATPQEWEQISKLLEQLDVPPRQVLIDAKIYEVSLTGAFASGVSAALQQRTAGSRTSTGVGSLARTLAGTSGSAGISLTAAMLVGHSRELLALVSAQEATNRSKIISAPSVIATDSISASINVGTEVPTLSSQAVSPIQSGGNSLFTNTVQNRNTGVTLSILARVNSSGIVTMIINQEVSAPVPPAGGSIQSPSFSKRNVSTQVTVQDGDTIAIGGIIQETETSSSAGIPVLHRLPAVGGLFGSKSSNKARTELIVFLTPRVIYDTNQVAEATDELKSKLKRLQKTIKE